MVGCFASGTGSGVTMSITDTSGLGLVWTQRAGNTTANQSEGCFVFTATVQRASKQIVTSQASNRASLW